jgi:hypothetical protein
MLPRGLGLCGNSTVFRAPSCLILAKKYYGGQYSSIVSEKTLRTDCTSVEVDLKLIDCRPRSLSGTPTPPKFWTLVRVPLLPLTGDWTSFALSKACDLRTLPRSTPLLQWTIKPSRLLLSKFAFFSFVDCLLRQLSSSAHCKSQRLRYNRLFKQGLKNWH